MADNTEDRIRTETEENKTTGRQTARHTWIGDKDEVRPDAAGRPVTRMTYPGGDARGTRVTRLVEKERKPYRGFITDEEVKHAEAAAEVDRMAREESRAARQEMIQTRVYTGFGSTADPSDEPEAEKKDVPKPRVRRSFNITIADDRKFRRLIAVAAVFAVLVLFELSFVFLKAQSASLPEKTAELRAQTEQLTAENAELQKEASETGDYEQIKENRDSWQRIKDKLAE